MNLLRSECFGIGARTILVAELLPSLLQLVPFLVFLFLGSVVLFLEERFDEIRAAIGLLLLWEVVLTLLLLVKRHFLDREHQLGT